MKFAYADPPYLGYAGFYADQHLGPFVSEESAGDWARRNNPHDNPCWQVVDLADPIIPVVAPE